MSAKIDDGGPAFPQGGPEMIIHGQSVKDAQGMSLRDWFAGQALPQVFHAHSKDCQAELEHTVGSNLDDANNGCSLRSWMTEVGDSDWADSLAYACYNIADAMLAARKGGER